MRRLGLLCVALLLASCAHSPPQVALPDSVKTIAVIPDIPPNLTLMTMGMTVFENDVDHVPVAEWHLDTVAVDAVSEALSSRYRIVRGSTDRSFETSSSPFATHPDLGAQVRRSVHTETPVDAYILLFHSIIADPFLANPVLVNRFGSTGIIVSKELHLLSKWDPVARAYLQMAIVDGQTLKTLASTTLDYPPGVPGQQTPSKALKGLEWTNHWADMSAAQRQTVKKGISELLAESIKTTLSEMRLAD